MEDEEFYLNLERRPRRLRASHAIRSLTQECWLNKQDFIQPLFVIDGNGKPEPIASMPGIFRYPIEHLVKECEKLSEIGIHGIILFPKIDDRLKDEMGSEALKENNLIIRAIRSIKKQVPELSIITDIALDPYTTHGHDGVLNKQRTDIDNDKTVALLAQMSILHANNGANIVAPSDMMDGRVLAIREALDISGAINTAIMAYSAKFASSYYGPFRDAVGSKLGEAKSQLNKSTYQLNPANRKEALVESALDEEEGADILMVKPAGPYLDIIRELRNVTLLPVAAYQVSAEYAQIVAAAEKGCLDLNQTRTESLLAIKRAGADIIITYFAKEQVLALNNNI